MDSSVKKDSYELLSMSSSDSDTPQQIQEINLKYRRKKLRKRLPVGRLRNYRDNHRQKCCDSQGKMMSLSFIIIILCCWLLILSWLIIVFNNELKRYDSNLLAVVASSQGIPESLQKCHAEIKELQRNQSDLYTQFMNFSSKLTILNEEISTFSDELQKLNTMVNSTNGSANSNELLYSNITSVGDKMNELISSIAQLKASERSLEIRFSELQQNLSRTKENSTLLEVPNRIEHLSLMEKNDVLSKLSLLAHTIYSNMTYLNDSLTAEIHSMERRLLLNSDANEKLSNLLNQNITMRLDAVEEQYLRLSNAIFNDSVAKDNHINSTWNVKPKLTNVGSKGDSV